MMHISNLTILPYTGEEEIIKQNSRFFYTKISEPVSSMIVLGASNKPEKELHVEAVIKDNIPVYKRKGGGGTVLLAPGMAVITLKAVVKNPYKNKQYFDLIHSFIIDTLFEKTGIKVELKGISDLVIGNKKILGSSIYRHKQILLYQGVLLVEAGLNRIGAYIKHPKQEPAYREGRNHHDFVANITQFYPECHTKRVIKYLQEAFHKSFCITE